MKITHYLYNSFLIETGNKVIAIDPGGQFLYFFRMTSLIPQSDWARITHIFITHGDPDHYWHADRVAESSGAKVICNKTMVRDMDGQSLMLGPRNKGLAFTTHMENLHTLSVEETIKIDDMVITGIKTTHGQLVLKIGPFSKTVIPGPEERIGWGAIGSQIKVNGKTLINLGDTLLHKEEWETIKNPDVLMIPIGGKAIHNTMDEQDALQAIEIMKPKLVIPCHYNCPAFFTQRYNPADENWFKAEVEKMGHRCTVLHKGESVSI
jgi:L-ascorbate metabolism protein UlaG (beta-lactamase superfamily)